jgi:hypothetical protein
VKLQDMKSRTSMVLVHAPGLKFRQGSATSGFFAVAATMAPLPGDRSVAAQNTDNHPVKRNDRRFAPL